MKQTSPTFWLDRPYGRGLVFTWGNAEMKGVARPMSGKLPDLVSERFHRDADINDVLLLRVLFRIVAIEFVARPIGGLIAASR